MAFVHNNWKGHFVISVSKLLLAYRIFGRSELSFEKSQRLFERSKLARDESSSKANCHLKNRADQNNRCHENAGKFHQNIVSSEISSKSQEFRRNLFALLLHNTVHVMHQSFETPVPRHLFISGANQGFHLIFQCRFPGSWGMHLSLSGLRFTMQGLSGDLAKFLLLEIKSTIHCIYLIKCGLRIDAVF